LPIDREKLQKIEAIQANPAQHSARTNCAVALGADFGLPMLIVLLMSNTDILLLLPATWDKFHA